MTDTSKIYPNSLSFTLTLAVEFALPQHRQTHGPAIVQYKYLTTPN